MLQKIRAKSTSLLPRILAGVICFVLAFFGFGAINLFAVGEPTVAEVNGEDITEQEYSQAIEREKNRLRELYGDYIDDTRLNDLVDRGLILDQLINTSLFLSHARDLDLVATRRAFLDVIENEPSFQQDNAFDQDLFEQVLQESGYSIQSLEQTLGRENLFLQPVRALESTSFKTSRESRDAATISHQTRNVSFLEYKDSEFLDAVDAINESESRTYYDMRPDEFYSEALYDFAYVELRREAFESEIEISEEDLANAYADTVAVEQSNAQRRARHILLKLEDGETAESARSRLNDIKRRVQTEGESFEDIAAEISEDIGTAVKGGDLGFAGRGAYVTEFENALWSLDVGELSEPVETTFGIHLIRLEEIEKVDVASFEDKRDELSSQLLIAQSQPLFDEAIERLDSLAFEMPTTLEPIHEQLGLDIGELDDVTTNSAEGIFQYGQVRTAFTTDDVLLNGYNSEVVLVGDDRAVVGRITDSVPPALQPFEEVMPSIETTIRNERARDLRIVAFTDALERAKSIGDLDLLASESNREWQRFSEVRDNDPNLPFGLAEQVFTVALTEGQERTIFEAILEQHVDTSYLVVVSGIEPGSYAELTEEDRGSLNSQLDTAFTNREVMSYIEALRSEGSWEYEIDLLTDGDG